jgi:hypothetical protein
MRRADHSSRGVLPTVVRCCVWSRNFKNEEAMTRVGSQRHRKKSWSCIRRTLHDLHSSPRGMRWERHVARMGERRCAYSVLLENRKGESLFGRPSLRRKIILNWSFTIYNVRAWTWLIWLGIGKKWSAAINRVLKIQVPYSAGNFLTRCETIHFSTRIMVHGVS